MGFVGRATSPRWGVQISWALRPVLVWKLVVRNVGSECVCDLQITLPEPNFRALCYTSGNNSPAVKFSLLFHSAPNACAPVSRCEGGGSYVSIPSLPAASSLGAELPSLAWDTLGHPPPGLGAPRSSRFAPEPGAAPGRAPRPRPGFSIGSLKITLLPSQETTWVCSCSRALFWLYKPPSSSSRGGKAGAGKSFEAGEGFVSPAAGLDGSQNTTLKEKHLLDGLERVITNLWGSPAAGGDGERTGTGAEKGVCSFCLVWLSVRLLFCIPICHNRTAGSEAPLAFPVRVREPEHKGCPTGLFAFLSPCLSCQGNTKRRREMHLLLENCWWNICEADLQSQDSVVGNREGCGQVWMLYFNEVVEIPERFQLKND